MRLVQLYVPRGERASVVETPEAEGVAYGLTDETSDGAFEAIASIPVPTGSVDALLSRLRNEASTTTSASSFSVSKPPSPGPMDRPNPTTTGSPGTNFGRERSIWPRRSRPSRVSSF